MLGGTMSNLNETAEQKRLNEAREAEGPVEEMGSLPVRTPMGNGTRGLQRQWRCVELLQPRSSTFTRLPLGRGWLGRFFRREAAALLCARPMERARSHY